MSQERDLHQQRINWVERTAVTASFICLLHCLGLPVLFAVLPVLSSALPIPASFHLWMIAIAVPMSSVALLAGRARHHATMPLSLGFFGLALLAIAAILFGETRLETPMTVAGSLALTWAHLVNWRLRHARSG